MYVADALQYGARHKEEGQLSAETLDAHGQALQRLHPVAAVAAHLFVGQHLQVPEQKVPHERSAQSNRNAPHKKDANRWRREEHTNVVEQTRRTDGLLVLETIIYFKYKNN